MASPCMLGAGAGAFVGPHLIEGVGRRVKDEDLAKVKRFLYQCTLAAMDSCVTRR